MDEQDHLAIYCNAVVTRQGMHPTVGRLELGSRCCHGGSRGSGGGNYCLVRGARDMRKGSGVLSSDNIHFR